MKSNRNSAITILAMVAMVCAYAACGGELAQVIPNNPTPSVTSISPSTAVAGGSGLTLDVTGSGFIHSSKVRWNGLERPTIFVDPHQLNASISATDIASAGTATVTVFNPMPGGGLSASTSFTIAEGPKPTPAISISPGSQVLDQGATQQFTAIVTGTSNTAVTWKIQEGNSGGAITSSGLYQAPSAAGTYHIVATSQADATLSAATVVTVNAIYLTMNTYSIGVIHGGTRAFNATVWGTQIDTKVVWSVQEGAAGGSVTSSGIYTAPETLGTYHVVAASEADPTQSANASVTVTEHGFTQAGNMIVARNYHTATLLQNGEVLITGGISAAGDGVVGSAELFDPQTGTFQEVGNMTTPRAFHTATLLADGRVLLVGGIDSTSTYEYVATSELYDPAIKAFSLTGPLAVGRAHHTASALANGKVLVAGGDTTGWTPLDSSETYDSATGIFTAGGNMSETRYAHSAAPLGNGQILVAGGTNVAACTSLSSADLYDPVTGNFTPTQPMPRQRAWYAATTLQDGRVLLTGGSQVDPCNHPGQFVSLIWQADVFDPGSQTYISISMTSPRSLHTATLLSTGQVLLAGGYDDWEDINGDHKHIIVYSTSSTELFDPATGSFSVAGDMGVERVGHAATLLKDGRALITGGSGDRTAEIYQ